MAQEKYENANVANVNGNLGVLHTTQATLL